MHAWLSRNADGPDLKINMITPATALHIRKVSLCSIASFLKLTDAQIHVVLRPELLHASRDSGNLQGGCIAIYRIAAR
jgi:hypothetical protein